MARILRIFGVQLFIPLSFLAWFTNGPLVTSGLMGTMGEPETAEEIVECTNTRRVVFRKSAEDGVDRYGSQFVDPIVYAYDLQLVHE
ncbi:hypothetical protein ABH897_002313 [Paenibacillus sp. RC73]|uniref:hypothetical protein n=1 Tax=Paenibacillus sp. RC73 TaxID=3156250 RepID=UPI003839812D